MKLFVLVVALTAMFQPVSAQTVDCRNIRSANQRLACYDKQPPASKPREKSAATQPDAQETLTDPNKFLDEEDARIRKNLKPICQHC